MYKVLAVMGGDYATALYDLTEKVERYTTEGWQPTGGVVINQADAEGKKWNVAQAIFKK